MFSSGSSFLSGILAIIIGLTSICGGLAGYNAGRPLTAEIAIEADGDLSAFGVAGQSPEAAQVIFKLINAISFRFAADDSVGQMQVKLNGNPVSTLTVQKQENGWAAVSDLFPSTMLTVSNEKLAEFIPAQSNPLASLQIGTTTEGMDPNALFALMVPVGTMIATFQSKAGETETGSFMVGGVEYTEKTPWNITTKEALELVLTTVKTILSDESTASLISQLPLDVTPESIEEALEDIQEKDDSELPVLSAAVYKNDAGDSATEILLEKEDMKGISFLSATAGKITNVTASALDQANLSLVIDEENKQYNFSLSFTSDDITMNLDGSLKVSDEGSDLEVAFLMPTGGDKPISLKIKAQVSWEAPVFEAAEGLKEVAIEDLMQDENGEAATAFGNELQLSLMMLVSKIVREYPDLMTLMSPSGAGQSPVIEETTVEEAPVDEIPGDEVPADEIPGDEAPVEAPPAGEGSAA